MSFVLQNDLITFPFIPESLLNKKPLLWCKGFLMSSQQESNLHLEFRKFLFYPLNYGTNMSNHYLLHTFTTHFPFSQITNSIKTNPVLHFLKSDYPKLKNPLGNIRSHFVGIPPISKIPICYTLLLHTFHFHKIPNL